MTAVRRDGHHIMTDTIPAQPAPLVDPPPPVR